ncbi:NUDIX hydrolase [[Mycoplasma] gypis]|uniref:NUDIX domain-containing protein n=1 Tax=[Mycoplasma] gypis TaxID=92404 RepID=A0ABZ2RPC6_9BACT|nr:NUDIX domain-containing protein [[Mycoplasma] gypis]MBN0919549.1 NUDIX domain-containing protein [[Mycoplasma] gypis]
MKKEKKLLYYNKWISLYETSKGFVYAQRKGVDSVAVLCFRKNVSGQREFLIRYQPIPEVKEKQKWTDCFPCPITGSCEDNEDRLQTAIRETKEEGGFEVTPENLIKEFRFLASTQSNEVVYSYIFDVTGLEQGAAPGDGTIFEQISYNKWHSEAELKEILKQTPVLTSLINLYYKLDEE